MSRDTPEGHAAALTAQLAAYERGQLLALRDDELHAQADRDESRGRHAAAARARRRARTPRRRADQLDAERLP